MTQSPNDSSDKGGNNNSDDLLKRAERLKDRTSTKLEGATEKRTNRINSPLMGWLGSSLKPLADKLVFLKQIFGPIYFVLAGLFSLIAKWFRWAAYKRHDGNVLLDERNRPSLSAKRFSICVLITVLCGVILHASLAALYMYSTKFTETVYVTGKQEIETGELYQFGGCTSLPCSTKNDNGKFYLIESSLYFPRLLYPEQEVYANIPQQDAACNVEGYGFYFRNLRWLYKSAQLYQHVMRVSCRPYTKKELERAVNNGEILRNIDKETTTPVTR